MKHRILPASVAGVHVSGAELAHMYAAVRSHSGASALPLWNAVICLDCEGISNSRGDECPACKSRSLVSLAQMLGGSLLSHKMERSHQCESVQFDAKITVELRRKHANELNVIIERLTNVIGPTLAREEASFHVNVEPTVAPAPTSSNRFVDNGAQKELSRSKAETIDPAA